MTQEEKQLLLKDLCGRLPYGVIVSYKSPFGESDIKVTCYNIGYVLQPGNDWWSECKPYLHPMSSMTEKEKKELDECYGSEESTISDTEVAIKLLNFYNINHFDYHGLIEKGLALEAPEDMYKI